MGQGQKSRWSRSPGQKCDFRSHLTILQVMDKIKGHRSGSKVTWVKVRWVNPSLKVMVLAGGLTSTLL